MRHKQLRFGHGFRVVLGDRYSQAAQMTLDPGEAEGRPDNHHRGADPWLFEKKRSPFILPLEENEPTPFSGVVIS